MVRRKFCRAPKPGSLRYFAATVSCWRGPRGVQFGARLRAV